VVPYSRLSWGKINAPHRFSVFSIWKGSLKKVSPCLSQISPDLFSYYIVLAKSFQTSSAKSSKSGVKRSSHQLDKKDLYKSHKAGYLDAFVNNVEVVHTNAIVSLLNPIKRGTMQGGISDKYAVLKSIQVHGRIVAGSNSAASKLMVFFVYDKEPTGTLPTTAQLLAAGSGGSYNAYCFMNDDNTDRFRVLKRYDLTVGSLNSANGAISIDFYYDMNALPFVQTNAADATGGLGQIKTGAVYGVMISSEPTGNTAPSVAYTCRTRYIDTN